MFIYTTLLIIFYQSNNWSANNYKLYIITQLNLFHRLKLNIKIYITRNLFFSNQIVFTKNIDAYSFEEEQISSKTFNLGITSFSEEIILFKIINKGNRIFSFLLISFLNSLILLSSIYW